MLMMDLGTLKKYRYLIAEILEIQEEIKSAYSPVQSPNGKEQTGHGSTPSNPTETAAMRILELRETLKANMEQALDLRVVIEHWLTTVEDPEIRLIVRVHYINGPNEKSPYHRLWTWTDTCLKVYGFADNRYARRKLTRFLHKEEGESEND